MVGLHSIYYRTMEEATSIFTQDYKYPVRTNKNSNRFRITVPKDMMDNLDIDNKDKLSVNIKLDEDQNLIIVYSTDWSEEDYTIKSSKHSSGEVTIPSGIGLALNMNNSKIEWKGKKYDNHSELHAITTKNISSYSGNTNIISEKSLRHVEQDVEYEGKEWDQEHFQLYLTVEEVEKLDWSDGDNLEIKIVKFGDKISLLLEQTDKSTEETKQANTTGEGQKDLFVYIPNDIVLSSSFDDKELLWIASDNNELILVPL